MKRRDRESATRPSKRQATSVSSLLLRRAHRNRVRALRAFGLQIPREIFARRPQDIAWRVGVMDRWIARHLDLAGGRQLPPWDDAEPEDVEGIEEGPSPDPPSNLGALSTTKPQRRRRRSDSRGTA